MSDRQAGALGQRLERGDQAVVGQDRRVDAAGQLSQLLERAGELRLRAPEQLVRLRIAGGQHALAGSQGERDRDEALLRAVVEVALEPAALGVAGLDDARARGGQFAARLGVGERQRDELREVRDPLLRALRERRLPHRRDDHRSPQPPAEHDRRAHRRAQPELAQQLGHRAGDALVAVDPLRPAAVVDHRSQRRTSHRPAGSDRHVACLARAPAAGNGHRAVGLVPDHVRRVRPEQAGDLLAHDREDGRLVGLAGDGRRDAPQRGLLLQDRAQRLLGALALGDVAQVAGEQRVSGQLRARDRDLDGELRCRRPASRAAPSDARPSAPGRSTRTARARAGDPRAGRAG